MSGHVVVVDYGVGNLLSVVRALEHCGATASLTSDLAEIEAAERLLLPGVGAFRDGMAGLTAAGLSEPIIAFAKSGRPTLGICLGMQMLASQSLEFGCHDGLGLIPGKVVPIPDTDVEGNRLKIPHIGWAELTARRHQGKDEFAAVMDGEAAYLVHSFQLIPNNPDTLLAECHYGGHRITAAVRSGNIIGFQFHPEKSSRVGFALLDAFLRL